jgi:hypothetical protein
MLMTTPSTISAYRVHALHDARSHAHEVHGASFEEAALAFVEDWHPAPDDDGDVSLVVRDQQTGREQCFRIDIDTGETAPCG